MVTIYRQPVGKSWDCAPIGRVRDAAGIESLRLAHSAGHPRAVDLSHERADMSLTDDALKRVRRVRSRARRAPFIWLAVFGVVVLAALIVVGWLLITWKVNAFVMAIPALIPLIIVLTAVRWLDRWEPEPPLLLALVAAYGAGASVLGTLWSGNFLLEVAANFLVDEDRLDAFSILVQGPLTEELIKGLGIVLVAVIARRELNGPLDGFIYAALIGAGFAFTENIIYFANSGSTGIEFVWLLVVRCILSPFAHALFTGAIGAGIGWAARRSELWRYLVGGAAGFLVAVVLHVLWNGGSVLVLPLLGLEPSNPFGWIIYYLLVQVPLFVAALWALLRLQDQDLDIVRTRLDEYRRAGWFTSGEVRMITDWSTRRAAVKWARTQPPAVDEAMRGFIDDATRLAFAREHAAIDKKDPRRRERERALLDATREHRLVLNEANARGRAGDAAQSDVIRSTHD